MKLINQLNFKKVLSTCFPQVVLLNSFFAKFLKNLVLWATFKNVNMIHILSQDDFSSRIRILFHVSWIAKLTRCPYCIIYLINMFFQVYKSLLFKFCTLMTFQVGLIKFRIFRSILLWNTLLINCSFLTSQVHSSRTSNDIEITQSML